MSRRIVYTESQAEMYLTRCDRRRSGLKQQNIGPNFNYDDQAVMLFNAIQRNNPKPFTKEDVRKMCAKKT